MRRLSISILLATVIVVSTAHADWLPLGVVTLNGVPNDVQIQGEGQFTVATSAGNGGIGAYEIWYSYPGGGFSSNGISNTLLADPFVSAYIVPGTCPGGGFALAAITQTGKIFCRGTTGQVGTVLSGGGSYRIAQLRHTPTGGNYLRGIDMSFMGLPLFGYATTWSAGAAQFLNNDVATALDVRRLGNVDYGFYSASNGASSSAFLVANGTRVHAQSFPVNIHPVRDVQVYGADAGQIRGLVAGDGGMEIVELQSDGGVAFAPVEGFSDVAVTSVAFESGRGDRYGNGFGMAVGLRPDGGTQILSAVPDPERQAMTWVPTTTAPPSPGITPHRVRCQGTFCVLYQLVSGANPLLYFNYNEPEFRSQMSVTIDEDAAPVPFTLDVRDPDGDAVFLTWDGGTGPVSLSYPGYPGAGNASRKTVSLSAPQSSSLCGASSREFPVEVHASDGFSNHVVDAGVLVTVRHMVPPGPPDVTPGVSGGVRAGGPPLQLQARPGAGVCSPVAYTWGLGTNAGIVGSAFTGDTATFTPPRNWCDPLPGVAKFEVTGTDGVLTSAPTSVTVSLSGWGPPDAPLGAGLPTVQNAGTRVTYPATEAHACLGSEQFPGVDTVWTLSSDAGVTFEAVGGSVTGDTASADAIVIVAPECVSGTASFTATPYTSGDPTRQAGPSATHSVAIQTVLVPLSSGGISLDGRLEAGSAQVSGSVSSNANCAERRGLSAVMELRDGAGAVVGSPQTVPLTGPQPSASWRFTLPPVGCAGGSFLVNGQLVDQGGPGPSAQWGPVVLPRQEAGISDVTVVRPPAATCGVDGVARATFEARADVGAGFCQDVTVTWEQLSGAPVAAAPAQGSQVSLTAEGGFEALISEPLRFRVTADAGGGNAASRELSIPVSVGNLVAVRHRTDVPVASESGIFGVEVALTNQSGCAVSGAEYREMLDGLRLVPGSARLDGVPVEVTVDGDVMTVPGVELPPDATRVLTYSARPRLLGRAQPRGQAFLRELAISAPEQGLPLPVIPGCGCSGGGAGLSSAALLLAVGLLRRSARRRAARLE